MAFIKTFKAPVTGVFLQGLFLIYGTTGINTSFIQD